MLEALIRSKYQIILVDPVALYLKDKVSANKITLIALFLGILILPALLLHLNFMAIFLLIASGYMDTLDGTIARFANDLSPVGSVFDIVADRVVELSAILGIFLVDTDGRGLLTLLMLGSCYLCVTCFLVTGIFTKNNLEKSFHYSSGIIERAEAFIFFGAIIIFPNYFKELALIFIILVFLTGILHIKNFIKYNNPCSDTK